MSSKAYVWNKTGSDNAKDNDMALADFEAMLVRNVRLDTVKVGGLPG